MNYKRETLQKRFERLEESRRTENERLTRESNNIGRPPCRRLCATIRHPTLRRKKLYKPKLSITYCYENQNLRLSDSSLNKVVTHHAELEKAGDNVYTYLFKKDPYREDDDLIAVVLNVEGVYFQEGAYSRRLLRGKDLAHVGSTYVQNFHKTIEETMQQGRHLPIMFVRIYEELGRDTAPLLKYREDRKERLRQQDEERCRQREQAKKEAEARQIRRLQDEKAKSSPESSSPPRTSSPCADRKESPFRFVRTAP